MEKNDPGLTFEVICWAGDIFHLLPPMGFDRQQSRRHDSGDTVSKIITYV
jgi:hypothetical protein